MAPREKGRRRGHEAPLLDREVNVAVERPAANGVFLNVPFDAAYESLFVTLVGTLLFLGVQPHCVLEVREQGDGRLPRIFDLMRQCRMSIHDLSRAGTPARFNMPFELGLACALKLTAPDDYEVFVLDSRAYRIDRKLSDYKGRDPLIHNGTAEGVLGCVLDVFVADRPAADLRAAARELRTVMRVLKREMKVASLFRPAMFRLLTATASNIAVQRGFIPARDR